MEATAEEAGVSEESRRGLRHSRADAPGRAASLLRGMLDLVGIRQREAIPTPPDGRHSRGAAGARVGTDLTDRNREQRGWEARKKQESRGQRACQSL